jgi:hypothetical protein
MFVPSLSWPNRRYYRTTKKGAKMASSYLPHRAVVAARRRKDGLLKTFTSTCSARAYLGKMIGSNFKNGEKKPLTFFLLPGATFVEEPCRRVVALAQLPHWRLFPRHSLRRVAAPNALQKTASLKLTINFSYVCPEPVLANIQVLRV